ncbi:Pectate lyase [Vigna unguiculata]|uniref:Pectate lyase n=1 Tax=Vigna unguiculata TaxID=3917 RepID=A0A4D6LVT7_VIGUN|nr:Pectate lyase [Vigna unguiculata]QCD92564.1 Pectate lyase [Vigna unguiculata]
MGGSAAKVVFILFITLAITMPRLEAGIAEFDDFLNAQAEEAHEIAVESYVPTPEFVTTVHLSQENSKRRGLRDSNTPSS